MTIEPHLDLDGSMSRRFGTVADEAQVKLTAVALEANGIERAPGRRRRGSETHRPGSHP